MALILLGVASLVTSCRRPPPARVFVTSEDAGELAVIDAERDVVVRTIHVGKRPRGVRCAADGKTVYVAVTGSPKRGAGAHDDGADAIVVVDVDRGAVVRTLPAGRDPEAFDISKDEKTLFASNEESAALAFVDVDAAKVVRTVSVGAEPEGVGVSPDGHHVYVTSESENVVHVVDTRAGDVVARIPTGARPRGVAFDPDGAHAFVTAELGGTLHWIDATSRAEVGRVRTGGEGVKPMGVAVSSDGRRAFVTNGREGSVAVVDTSSRRVERTIEGVGSRVWGVGVHPRKDKLYVAAGGDVAVIDLTRAAVEKRIPVGAGAWGVAVAKGSR